MEMKIKQQLLEYECGTDYEPLQVTFTIRPPLFLANPYIYFDGLVSYLCLREALGESYWSLPTNTGVDINLLNLPLKRTDDVYHASVGIMEEPQLRKNTIYKRFTDKETYHLNKKLQKGKIRTNAGHYKDFMINLPLIITRKIKFYCCGDKEHLERLLGNVTNLGKKTSIGGGHIKEYSITSTDMDYSFYKDDQCLKPIPSDMDILPVTSGAKWKQCTYKPPYWRSQDMKMCRVPPNQLIGEPNNA